MIRKKNQQVYYNVPDWPLWSRIGAKMYFVLSGLSAQENSCPGYKS